MEKETLEEVGSYQQELFNYLHDLGIIALQSEMHEIERIVLSMQEQDKNKYSDEEVLEFANYFGTATKENLKWFEQFKNK